MRSEDTVPGGRAVALSNPALLSGSVNCTRIFVRGRTYEAGRRDYDNSINRLVTSTNFFETLGIPVVRGRGFSPHDHGFSEGQLLPVAQQVRWDERVRREAPERARDGERTG